VDAALSTIFFLISNQGREVVICHKVMNGTRSASARKGDPVKQEGYSPCLLAGGADQGGLVTLRQVRFARRLAAAQQTERARMVR
jgi:uncharacterized radical SAM superfamily protein